MKDDLHIRPGFTVPAYALDMSAVKASGPGGQHVNTTNSAVQLRVDLNSFYVPDHYRKRILRHRDRRITKDGVVVVDASGQRSQHRNRDEAVEKLVELLVEATHKPKPRKRTRPSWGSRQRARKAQVRRKEIKAMRKTPKVPPC